MGWYFSTKASEATAMSMHPSIFSCLLVNETVICINVYEDQTLHMLLHTAATLWTWSNEGNGLEVATSNGPIIFC